MGRAWVLVGIAAVGLLAVAVWFGVLRDDGPGCVAVEVTGKPTAQTPDDALAQFLESGAAGTAAAGMSSEDFVEEDQSLARSQGYSSPDGVRIETTSTAFGEPWMVTSVSCAVFEDYERRGD